jgi:hypothetical protein
MPQIPLQYGGTICPHQVLPIGERFEHGEMRRLWLVKAGEGSIDGQYPALRGNNQIGPSLSGCMNVACSVGGASPDALILDFFRSAYELGATLGGWDRPALERPNPLPPDPR